MDRQTDTQMDGKADILTLWLTLSRGRSQWKFWRSCAIATAAHSYIFWQGRGFAAIQYTRFIRATWWQKFRSSAADAAFLQRDGPSQNMYCLWIIKTFMNSVNVVKRCTGHIWMILTYIPVWTCLSNRSMGDCSGETEIFIGSLPPSQ